MEIFTLVILTILYFVPTLVAMKRKHPQAVPIFALNFFLGWTGFGWIGSLVWSLTRQV